LWTNQDEVPSLEAVAILTRFGQLRPEKIPLWAAYWLVAGYDGEHLVHLAGLHGDDPRVVGDALPAALRDCGVELPESDEAVATIVYTQLARMFLDGALDAQTVSNTASAVLLWTGYPDGIRAMPLGRLLYIDAEWGTSRGRAHKKLAEVVREACEEQLRIGPVAL
jgi:hypothetical protein